MAEDSGSRWDMGAKRRHGASVRIVGSKTEISDILATFGDKGFIWRSNEHFYPRINQPDFYSYYLEDFDYAPAEELTRIER
ncbi:MULTISPECIES: hypothetical protein [unclassified Microcoleus]|uniref:hypothetical protein n=1 Tax=unclassified Microcoleus TaxID=2642155 RepID=UPI002FD528F3